MPTALEMPLPETCTWLSPHRAASCSSRRPALLPCQGPSKVAGRPRARGYAVHALPPWTSGVSIKQLRLSDRTLQGDFVAAGSSKGSVRATVSRPATTVHGRAVTIVVPLRKGTLDLNAVGPVVGDIRRGSVSFDLWQSGIRSAPPGGVVGRWRRPERVDDARTAANPAHGAPRRVHRPATSESRKQDHSHSAPDFDAQALWRNIRGGRSRASPCLGLSIRPSQQPRRSFASLVCACRSNGS